MEYETTWRNKWITANATNIDQMIGSLMRSIEELQEMKRDGIDGDFQCAEDDYIFFRTNDAELAKKFRMGEVERFDEENDNEDSEDGGE